MSLEQSTIRSSRHVRVRTVRALTLMAIVALVTCLGAWSAAAQTQDPPPTETHSWSLAPTGDDPGQPGSRPNLTYTLAPGAVLEDSVTLWNYSDVQLTFHVYATDAFNNRDGAFDILTEDEKPDDVGAWVALPQPYVTVPANTSLVMPITITVPANASPGDHVGGIVAASQTPGTDDKGHFAVLDRRTGSRIYLRVEGAVQPDLVIEDVHADYQASVNPLEGELDVTYTIRNAGNVRLGARPTVVVKDLFGTVGEKKGDPVAELLPGNEITRTEHFTGVAATVRVSADVSVEPFAPKGTEADPAMKDAEAAATTHAWAIPWSLVLLLLLIGAGILLARWLRSRRHGAPPSRGTGPGGGGSPPPRTSGYAEPARHPAGVRQN